jgi:poly(3-hydroxybutyrate) depolymerase
VSIKIVEIDNACFAVVPDSYQPNVPHGVLVWLHGSGGYKQDELAAIWKDLCSQHDLILLAPQSKDPQKWQRAELAFIRKTLDDVISKYNVDRKRIAVAGVEGGGAMAYLFGFSNRELISGIAAVDTPLPAGTQVPPTDAVQRQAFFLATAAKSQALAQVTATIQQLRGLKYPVTVHELGDKPRPLTAEENGLLTRWVDTLDRI